jgi:NAD(P)-dependent dehydrogenase (short-subunit alcohol dehydrogenase family)
MQDLNGLRALVMGGSSGIGRATSRLLAARGADVLVNGRDPEKAEAVVSELHDGCEALAADATDPADVAALAERTGRVDILVLAAGGTSGGGPFADLDLDELDRAGAAKFGAHMRVLQALLPVLAEDASITFVSAGSARSALSGTAGLAAINGALEAVVGPLAAELAPRRVNAVSPGVIRTPWWDALGEELRDATWNQFAAALPVGRIGEPEEVAEAIALLATDRFITGAVLPVDGGGSLAMGARL